MKKKVLRERRSERELALEVALANQKQDLERDVEEKKTKGRKKKEVK